MGDGQVTLERDGGRGINQSRSRVGIVGSCKMKHTEIYAHTKIKKKIHLSLITMDTKRNSARSYIKQNRGTTQYL